LNIPIRLQMAVKLTPGNMAIYIAMQQRPRIQALEDRVARLEKLVMNAPLPMDDMVVVSSPPVQEPPPPVQPVQEGGVEAKPASGGSSCVIN
jgi:hypothetical protein